MIFKFSSLVQNVYQNVARVESKKKKKKPISEWLLIKQKKKKIC